MSDDRDEEARIGKFYGTASKERPKWTGSSPLNVEQARGD